MGKSRGMTAIDRAVESKMASQEFGGKLLESQGLDPKRLGDVAPMDDAIPPSVPANIKVTPFMKALDVSWDAPIVNDHVATAIVEVTPVGGTVFTKEVTPPVGLTMTDLGYVQHSVRVRFKDIWGRLGDWSARVVGTPAETADYRINLAKAQQAGRLQGMGLALNDSADPQLMVKNVSLAQPDGTNLLPLIEVDFDQWNDAQAWSPTDTDKAGNRYIIHEAPAGLSGVVRNRSGLKWLEVTRSSTTDGWYIPFAHIRNRGIQPGSEYICSAFARGNSGVRVRLRVVLYKDTAGLDPFILETDVVTLDGSNGGARLFVKFTAPAGYNTVRIVVMNVDDTTVSYWTKFQLEYAGGKIEPSAWTPGILTTGVIVARMLTALDVNAVNAIFKNASIETAAIKELTADKITGGTISTTTINVLSAITLGTNGVINAGPNIKLDSGGILMARVSGYTAPSINRAFKISSTDDLSAMNFYVNGTSSMGVQLRADGNGTVRGAVALQSTRGGDLAHLSSARIEAISGETINHKGFIFVDGDIHTTGFLKVGNTGIVPHLVGSSLSLAPGAVGKWASGGVHPRYFFPEIFSGSHWGPLGWFGSVWADTNATDTFIHNDSTVTYTVRFVAIY